ncbi:MAG: hypothetical protein KDB22_17790 [Planctomycetales bacterium]|nr:hypothetical protein [Planctomycetales bacterium]
MQKKYRVTAVMMGCLSWLFAFENHLPAQEAVLQEASVGETLPTNETAAETSADKPTTKPASAEFMRVLKEGKQPVAMQTAVVTYSDPDDPALEVVLIGAVHIAEASYYSELNQLFRRFDALLYEMVFDPEQGVPDPEERGVSPVSTIQVTMKDALGMTFQLDEIKYDRENFVHADMTPTEFFECMESRKEGVMQMLFRSMGAGLAMQNSGRGGDLDLLSALVASDRTRALRRALADQMELADGQMAALTGDDGKSTLITERNAKAFEVLQREIDGGKKKLGIFYGAGHLKDMDKRLREQFGMKAVKTEWLNAWDLR